MKTFHIRVNQTNYEDYPCYSFYDIKAAEEHDAKKEARKEFCRAFGFQFKDTNATIITTNLPDSTKG